MAAHCTQLSIIMMVVTGWNLNQRIIKRMKAINNKRSFHIQLVLMSAGVSTPASFEI